MKKILLTMIACVLVSGVSFASNTDLFELNESKIQAEFSELNALETYVDMNEHVTIQNIYTENSALVAGMNLAYNPEGMMGHNRFSLEEMEWGSFAWGFCCWPIGVFTVLLNKDKGSNHKISYFIGWGVSAVLGAVTYGVGF